jgi:N-acetylglutamate synthase-like GNAT family acetyltransferase
MRHATEGDLDRLEPFLGKLRRIDALVERKRGIFYWKSKSFLHFHEHENSLYADVRLTDGKFTRVRIGNAPESSRLLMEIRKRVAKRVQSRVFRT